MWFTSDQASQASQASHLECCICIADILCANYHISVLMFFMPNQLAAVTTSDEVTANRRPREGTRNGRGEGGSGA